MADLDFDQLEAVFEQDPQPPLSYDQAYVEDHRPSKKPVPPPIRKKSSPSPRTTVSNSRPSRHRPRSSEGEDGSRRRGGSSRSRSERRLRRGSRRAGSGSSSAGGSSRRRASRRRRHRGRSISSSGSRDVEGRESRLLSSSSSSCVRRRRRRRSSSRSARRRTPSPESQRRAEQRRLDEVRAREEAKRKAEIERKLKDEQEKRRKEIDEARRDDLTVLILNLSLKASERDVWKFFSEKAGKVRDIQIIRDTRSGKSKGVSYVELYTPTAVMTALSLSGQLILDQPIIVQASQAEKNRAAKAAKQQQAEMSEHGPLRLYVGGLVDQLANLQSHELKQLFSPFGEVVSVDIHKDPYTGRCKGYAFIQFRHAQEAREAMTAMNGFEIAGAQLKVGYATDTLAAAAAAAGGAGAAGAFSADLLHSAALAAADATADNERLDDEGGGLLSGVNPRIILMQKLQRLEGGGAAPGGGGAGASVNSAAAAAAAAAAALITAGMAPNICLEPLFTAQDLAKEGPDFLEDVAEDVATECSKYGTVLKTYINKDVVDGKVWVKFANNEQAAKANQAMTGRFFAGNKINVSFVPEHVWTSCVPP